jgi:hypothetical protein
VRGRFIHKDWTSAAKYTIIFYKRVKGGLLLKNKAFVSFLLAVCLILNSVCAVFANETIELYKTVHIAQERTADYLKQTVPEPVFGSVGGEWTVFGLARAGMLDEEYARRYYEGLAHYVSSVEGVLSTRKYTEYARAVLALAALGKDAHDVGGYNLLQPLTDYKMVTRQGLNGAIFALLALDVYDAAEFDELLFEEGSEANLSLLDYYFQYILTRVHADGGFGLGDKSDPDVTAMALCELSKYREDELVKGFIQNALGYLSAVQKEDGGFVSEGVSNFESVAQVVIALCQLGIDPAADSRFIKNGNHLIDVLLSYQNSDGSFSHTLDGESDLMATEQGMLAMTAYVRLREGKTGLYDMPRRDGSYSDLTSHWAREAALLMLANEIILPDSNRAYGVDRPLRRDEFTRAAVCAVGGNVALTDTDKLPFADVSDEYRPYVAYALQNGLVNGVDETHFAPQDNVTRAQTAAILYRYLQKQYQLGMSKTSLDTVKTFTDWADCPEWSQEAFAFCVDSGILIGNDGRLLPNDPITKAEMSVILQRFIGWMNEITA